MRKILLATNAHQVKASAVDFGCYIANLTRSPLTGVFLEKKNKVAEILIAAGEEEYESTNAENAVSNTNLFCNRCLRNDARHSVHYVYGNPLTETIKESLYADVILADGNTSFNEDDGWPSQFIKDLLEDAKCPVIITPFDFDEINEVVFAYDGTDSSIFAMKQFIYLFPELNDIKITLLQVLKDDDDITEKKRLREFLMMYFDAVHYDTLYGDAEAELFKRFLAQRNKMLVMGAYGRKKFLGHSTADILLKTLNIPIFIAHN
jgi:hypothetical protein